LTGFPAGARVAPAGNAHHREVQEATVILYIMRRVLSAISVVIVTLLASFVMFFVAPSDPAGVICGPRCNTQRYEDIRRSLNLDRPVIDQFGEYIKGLAVGRTIQTGGITIDCPAPCMGYSFTLGQPVTKLLAQAVPVTVSIVLGAAVVFLTLGVLSGTAAARRPGTAVDRVVVGTSLTVNSIPYFIWALIVSLYLTVLPPSQYTSILTNPLAWASGMTAAWFALGTANAAAYTRYSRNSMIESLSEDYVRTARSKGISERRVVYRHGLRAAITPVATIFGVDLAAQLTGAIFTEGIFGLPGLGVLTIRAFNQFDLPVLMGGVIVGAVVLVALNLMVDLLYTVLDPRVRLG
jgi:peptide/nickel transport system permease protein